MLSNNIYIHNHCYLKYYYTGYFRFRSYKHEIKQIWW